MTGMTRDTAEVLLPFLANDTLRGDERAGVEAWVEQDAILAGELAALRAIRAQMQNSDAGQSPGAFGLARLIRDINREPQANVRPASHWKAAAAIAVALLVGQGLWTSGVISPDKGFNLAGEEHSTADTQVRVIFVPDASEVQIREILLANDLEITEGPSALGVYTLRYTGAASVTEVAAGLAARTEIIASVTGEQP